MPYLDKEKRNAYERAKRARKLALLKQYCKQCGELMLGRKRKFCNQICSDRSRNPQPRFSFICIQCGKEGKSFQKQPKFCDSKCVGEYRRRRQQYECMQCRKWFIPKAKKYNSFCGRKCSFKYLALNGKLPNSQRQLSIEFRPVRAIADGHLRWIKQWTECRCGTWFIGSLFGSCCSKLCKDKLRMDTRAAICNYCSSPYKPNRLSQWFCSEKCRSECRRHTRRKHHKIESQKWGKTYRSRARKYGVNYEPVNRLIVFERDKYRCHLCGKKAKQPTLDHIIPMSRGGDHTYRNVACACFICNSRKRDMVYGQLRLIG